MSTHLIIWNPNESTYTIEDFSHDFYAARFWDGVEDFTLCIHSYDNISVDDNWVLIQRETENDGIAAYGSFMDPSELNYDEYDKEFYNFEIFMVDRRKCHKLSLLELFKICPEINNLKNEDIYTLNDDQEKEFTRFILKAISNMDGPNDFINYSKDMHPDLIDEFGGESKFDKFYERKEKDKGIENYQLSLVEKAVLKSCIGQKILHFCCWQTENRESNYISFCTKDMFSSRGIWVNLVPFLKTDEDKFTTISLFTDDIFPNFNKEYNPQKYTHDGKSIRINEILNNIKVVTDTYEVNKGKKICKFVIDSGIIFEFPDFSVFLSMPALVSAKLDIEISDDKNIESWILQNTKAKKREIKKI